MGWSFRTQLFPALRLFNFANNNESSNKTKEATSGSTSTKGYNKLTCTPDDDNNGAIALHTINANNTTGPTKQQLQSPRKSWEMASEDSDNQPESESDSDDERLTCVVCDRSFDSSKLLERHRVKRRHYGCSICESVFPSHMSLESHREQVGHWSDEEDFSDCDSDMESDSDDYDSDSSSSSQSRRQKGRLLL